MIIPGLDEYTIRSYINKFALLIGILIIIYAILWMLAELKIIPMIYFAIFPQIVLLLIGIFIVYLALSRRNQF
ncbi:MAG: hypothetical protein IJH63_14860 [Methanobrevibacter sp.]|uniref:Uncharacterized protein n=1 Tax=Methanobrevibacter millerae TaxID=230361 RepID=A0A8T3VIZ7_9EURY|nr:hypothetical protein [Methanobrevibacter millerae]MBE6506066.1 hypothetical protein [Methanobrevibacter millerae]MBR0371971.1 hypothetical protein [Methanobrevibacter sp.]